ncbi:MAG: hypothetical protein HKN50_05510, partial [Gammaproteobacteria bacterium]|nr:hypothetical protein [Gammaproteobacteria bacterium]
MRQLIGITALAIILPGVVARLFMAVLREQPVKWFIAEYAGRNLQVIKHRTLLVCNVALADF